jgi:hypothetical protein
VSAYRDFLLSVESEGTPFGIPGEQSSSQDFVVPSFASALRGRVAGSVPELVGKCLEPCFDLGELSLAALGKPLP